MLNAFLKFIDRHKLVAKNDKVLLAVSGGIDSVVLAHLFNKAGFNFGIAHCNFQLRGRDSDGDEEFVAQMANNFGVAFHVTKFETTEAAQLNNISTQMAARNLRYAWFEELLAKFSYAKLATAHHKNDNLETIIFNLTKGTGIAGMHGIKAKNGSLIRPLLFASRDDIEGYLKSKDLSWREDSSNSSVKYHRNLIRHKVVPLLKKINPNLENSVETTIQRISAVEEFFLAQVDSLKNTLVEKKGGDIWLDLERLDEIAGKEAVLAEILKEYGFNFSQVGDVVNVLGEQSGKMFYSSTHVLNVDRSHIIVSRIDHSESREIIIQGHENAVKSKDYLLMFEKLDPGSSQIVRSKDLAYLDFEKMEFPLVLRQWKAGDSFHPFGMKGKKKLSDFMIDAKIPVNLKSKVDVLTSGENIVWIVGYRIDDRFKVTSKTKAIFKISKLPDNAEAV